jgi:hypothetical protein
VRGKWGEIVGRGTCMRERERERKYSGREGERERGREEGVERE